MLKKSIIRIIFLALFFIAPFFASAEHFLNVLIYGNISISSLNIKVQTGKYDIIGNNTSIGAFEKNTPFELTVADNKIKLTEKGKVIGTFDSLFFNGKGFINTLLVKPLKLAERIYDNDFKITVVNGSFRIINHVELENYVAGVVDAECGGFADQNFFEVQAILCRTYALYNINKHWKEGYNLCDQVHCQVYRGKTSNSDVLMAVYLSNNRVIIDKDSNIVSAAFCANCGGQTVNSEDAWTKPHTYLKTVVDTFCIYQKNALWQVKMPASKWLNYLAEKYQYPINDSLKRIAALNFKQPSRKTFFDEENKIPLKNIRADLIFKSTWFSIYPKGDTLLFQGRGYGHGVGLCQEGALKMCRLQIPYLDIIHFYYKDVDVISLDQLEKKQKK
jgi:stage II sporulation protein D